MIRIKKAGSLGSNLFQWATGKRWYWINEKNMDIQGPLTEQSNLMNALLSGLVATIKGNYSRKEKKLKLVL